MTVFDLPTDVASYLRNVRVKNVGEKDVVMRYNSIPYIVRAGDEATVPFEAMCVWLGDPRAGETSRVDNNGGDTRFIPARRDEIVRLRQLYGMYAGGGSHELVHGEFTDRDGDGKEVAVHIDYPRMEAWMSDGQRLYTVLEDPEGLEGAVPDPLIAKHQSNTDEVIQRLEREVQMLKDQRVREDAGFVPGHQPYTPTSEADLPRDEAPDPTAAPLPKSSADNLDFETTQAEPKSKWTGKTK